MSRRPLLLSLAMAAAACGDGSPTSPPPPVPTYTVSALVFYDQDGDRQRDADETGVVPGAELVVGGRAGAAQPATGRASITGVPAGIYSAQLREASLPPFYRIEAAVPVTVPQAEGSTLELGATLPIGDNEPARYMAFGDSITDGEGAGDEMGYRSLLEPMLVAHFGQGEIVNQAVQGTRSNAGADRIHTSLRRVRPAYTLILYGTNDWNDRRCRESVPCFTIDSLRTIVRAVRGAQGLPVLGTIIPVNTGFDARAPESRNDWVAAMNDLIRPMGVEEGAVVADLYKVFMAQDDFHTLFTDHVHPNDAGYRLMADEFFRAITQPAEETPAAASGRMVAFPSLEPVAPRYRPPRTRGPYKSTS